MKLVYWIDLSSGSGEAGARRSLSNSQTGFSQSVAL
jgi:hypothetical protein